MMNDQEDLDTCEYGDEEDEDIPAQEAKPASPSGQWIIRGVFLLLVLIYCYLYFTRRAKDTAHMSTPEPVAEGAETETETASISSSPPASVQATFFHWTQPEEEPPQ